MLLVYVVWPFRRAVVLGVVDFLQVLRVWAARDVMQGSGLFGFSHLETLLAFAWA